MKSNLFINVMCVAMTLIAATACTEEEASRMKNSEGITFAISLPGEPMTRYGEGEKATYLSYAVYEADSQRPVIKKENEELTNKPTTLTLPLVVGKTYDIIFWADAYNGTEAPYTVDFNTQQLTVSYDNAVSNDEKRDAFFAGLTDLTVTRDMGTQTIEMKRPFAQFNVVADDLATSGIDTDNLKTSVSVEGVPTELNLLDGTISTKTTDVTFAEAPKAEGTIMIGGKSYDYLSMNYLLVGTASADATAQKSIHNCTFTYRDGTNTQTIKIPNIPMQRNYRTNVYGSLFNNNVNFSISILPGFDNEYNHKIIESASDLQTALTEGGNWVLQEDLTTDMVLAVTPGKELNLDLGGNTLKATKLSMTYKDGTENISGKTCTFANGVIDIKPKSGSSIQIVAKEMQVVFDNVTINSEDQQSAILLGTSGGDFSEAVHSTLVMRNCTINAKKTSGIVVGRQQNVTLENTVINLNENGYGITQNGTIPGSVFTLKNCTINSSHSAIYLSNQETGDPNTLTVDGGTYSSADTPFELKKTNVTIKNATIKSIWNGEQKYTFNNSGTGAIGYGIALVGYEIERPYAEDGTTALFENNTFQLSATGTPINIAIYDGASLVEYNN